MISTFAWPPKQVEHLDPLRGGDSVTDTSELGVERVFESAVGLNWHYSIVLNER